MTNPIETLLIKALEGATTLIKGCEKPEDRKDMLLIGEADNLYQPKQKENMYLSVYERLRHTYILGATGTGKSKLLESLIRQDLLSNRGFCFLDPHGDLFRCVLNFIAGFCSEDNYKEMAQLIRNRLVLIDPTCKKFVTGFNPLEAIGVDSHSQSLEFMGIIKKIWSDAYWGPRMEELLRNTMTTLSLHGLTLLEVRPLLTDSSYRARLVSRLHPGEVKEYWLYRYNQLSDRMQGTYREPILNRLSVFLSDPRIRMMVGLKKSTINFRQIMDQGKWLLVNLSKGDLKSNSHLLGAFLISKLQLAALSRVDVPERRRFPFFVYVDEFQNFISEDFETILSEARKYGLGLTLAHQNIDQLDRKLRSAILGNTLTQVFFRMSNQDASTLAAEIGQKEKPIIQRRLVDLKLREAYFKKKGERARMMKTFYVPPSKGTEKTTEAIKELSMSYHARPWKDVEQEIANRTRFISGEGSLPEQKSAKSDPYKGKFAPQGKYEEGHEW